MPQKPLLIFPKPKLATKNNLPRGGGKPHLPDFSQQVKRIGPKLTVLEEAFEAERAELTAHPTGIDTEQVLVLETVGSIQDFLRAVRGVRGLEWLADVETDEIDPDEDFYEVDIKGKKKEDK
ncbi:MAG: hypothetical protein ACE5GQ_04460, partial [Nitrospinales bacterium]